jgi:hypothetical protein
MLAIIYKKQTKSETFLNQKNVFLLLLIKDINARQMLKNILYSFIIIIKVNIIIYYITKNNHLYIKKKSRIISHGFSLYI